ncbi:hypothetical protein EDI_008360 [Entamoeba dispar SAW760]|uniref:Uncharacterized protein n=1 Tax=Entamoeba dispar (strain ATCC PRA-260 / SAW760) TaxID=370354 RepID=B0E8T0_ENTDS|nr:uncharacterized protein EDI_008360 [Entamoeba dispar SAW760]EDR29056.1 hypothetical protein EDI_008360 [Entamoeba dispar SAW760]|eukprot:EDR29056.1 hypothetical protein EDI_008360 [Entamoeba dispar SAW760]
MNWNNFELPHEPSIDLADQALLFDPCFNKYKKKKGYYATGVPVVMKEGDVCEVPNQFGVQELANAIPYYTSRVLAENHTIDETHNYFNLMQIINVKNKKYFIYSHKEGEVELCLFNGEIIPKGSIVCGGIIRKIVVIKETLWKNPSTPITPPPIFCIANESNIFVYVMENENPIRINEFHINDKIDDIQMICTDDIYLIIAVNNKIHLISINTKEDNEYIIPYREGDDGEARITFSLFPKLIICRGFGMYTLNILTKEVETKYGFSDKVFALTSHIYFPFHVIVITETSLFIMDTRTFTGVASHLHVIPKQHLYYDVECFFYENKLTCIIPTERYCIIVPFKFNVEKLQFSTEYASCLVKLPLILPFIKKKLHYRILGFYAIPHENELIMILIDTERRITAQKFTYGEYNEDIKKHSIILSEKHTVERPIPLFRRKIDMYREFLDKQLSKEPAVKKKIKQEVSENKNTKVKNIEYKHTENFFYNYALKKYAKKDKEEMELRKKELRKRIESKKPKVIKEPKPKKPQIKLPKERKKREGSGMVSLNALRRHKH